MKISMIVIITWPCVHSPKTDIMCSSRILVAFSSLLLTTLGCTPPSPSNEAAGSSAGNVLTERKALQVGAKTKHLGEDCTLAGQSECHTGLCLHYRPEPLKGYICSDFCADSADCPSRWECVTLIPGSQERVCSPPPEWVPTAVAKQARVTSPPPAPELPQSPPAPRPDVDRGGRRTP